MVALSATAMAQPWHVLASAVHEPGLVTEHFRDDLAGFYAARGDQPLWFDGDLPSARQEELIAVLGQAEREGLSPADYLTTSLTRACAPASLDAIRCELQLSDSLLRYARDVGYGAVAAVDMDPHWHIPQDTMPVRPLLDQVAVTTDLTTLLQQLPPPHVAYRRLRDALAESRQLAASCHWLPIPEGPSLHPGDRADRVLALRERLGAEQPAVLASEAADLYDAALEASVLQFQARHGLDEDGIVGARTLAALNASPEDLITLIRLNMERWRWLPRELGASHILVNLAGFDLTLTQPDRPALRMRAISGRPDRTSPAFSSRVNRLVINPDWTVPRRLAVEDMLPQLRRNPEALLAKNIHILRREGGELVEVDPTSVDWQRYHKNNFPFVLRQSPGPRNSLGQLKFVMPNPFDIYIHDTPAKGLFAKPVRTLSSGCIRVEKPLSLAARLVGDEPENAAQWLQQRIDQGETDNLRIPEPVPVYLVYLTAWVDEAGNLQLRNDVYGRDVQMRDRFAFP